MFSQELSYHICHCDDSNRAMLVERVMPRKKLTTLERFMLHFNIS